VRAIGPDAETMSEAQHEALLKRYLDFYGDHIADRSRPFDGIVPLLEKFKGQGVKLAVCTNKNEEFVRPLLEARGMMPYIDGIVGGNTLPERKPSGVPLLHLAKQLSAPVEATLMVGDSESDVLAARDAHLPFVLVSYGYRKSLDLYTAGAVAVIDTMPALLDVQRPQRTAAHG
ncbi:MAG: HAD-IA family hydrolase, partial [Luteibacter sp.]